MGATVPAPPILKRPAPAGFLQAPVVSEAQLAYIAPQQQLTSLATAASEPAPIQSTQPPAPRRQFNPVRRPLRRPSRYGPAEF